jgi:glycosyltransferase involved in cell wall biosynthesis
VTSVKKDFILLIPCYNNLNGLLTSLKSIHHPFNLFEVLIIDDGSTEIIIENKIRELNPHLVFKIIRLTQNSGILTALNTGLDELNTRSDYNYIARLDCGDTCHPNRFSEQVKFLNENPKVGLLGTWCSFTDSATGKSYLYKTKTKHDEILKEMHIKCSFIHPTVMFRKEVLAKVGHYPKEFIHAEDYAFFWDILTFFEGAVIPRNYVNIELATENISSKYFTEQLLSRKKIVSSKGSNNWFKLLGITLLNFKRFIPTTRIKKLKFYFYPLAKKHEQ